MARTAINVNKQSVAQLLETGKTTPFVIPEYQRPYAWSDDQVTVLFDDLWEFTATLGGSEREGTSNPQPIGFSGILLAKRQNSFYCTYFLHNRNVADTKSPYPIKRLEVIRWFNQKSMVFNQSLS